MGRVSPKAKPTGNLRPSTERRVHVRVNLSVKKLAVGIPTIFALSLVTAAVVSASPDLKLDKKGISSKACKVDGAKQLVNVRYKLTNDFDSGFGGNAWANDTIDRQLRIWQLPTGTFCVQVADHGKFVTFAGASPSGLSTVSAGVKGELEGGYISTDIVGTFAPTLPVRGDLGTFDLMCTNANTCPGTRPSWKNYFAPGVTGIEFAQWGWIYKAGRNGTWLNQDNVAAAASGDITGQPRGHGEDDNNNDDD